MHLKRFNDLGNNRWVKSQKVVHFPYENFNPTPYLASIPQETILRHNDLKTEPVKNCDIPEGCEEGDSQQQQQQQPKAEESDELPSMRPLSATKGGPSTLERRKRLISTSLTKTPVLDGELVDYHNHRLQAGYGEFDLKYRLYAVVVSKEWWWW